MGEIDSLHGDEVLDIRGGINLVDVSHTRHVAAVRPLVDADVEIML